MGPTHVLYIYYILTFFVTLTTANNAIGIMAYTVSNWKMCSLPTNTSMVIRNEPIQECLFQCNIRPRCKAVNFFVVRRACHLLDTEVITGASYNTRPCMFIRKGDIQESALSFCHGCVPGQVCDEQSESCVIRECSDLHITGVEVRGNRLNVGARVLVVPHTGFTLEDQSPYVVCQEDGSWSDVPVVYPIVVCEDGWDNIDKSCYTPLTSRMYFNDAKTHCYSLGGHLPVIDTVEKSNWLKQYANEKYVTGWWLGITDAVAEGTWINVQSGEPTRFSDWGPGEPDNRYASEHCAVMGYNNEAWADVRCASTRSVICEKSSLA